MCSTYSLFSVLDAFQARKIFLKLVLGAWELLHFPLVLMSQLNKTQSVVFYCNIVVSLYFYKNCFSRLFRVS